MNTTQLYYTRILDTFIEEYEDQLTQVKEGHCMKVVGLPLDVLVESPQSEPASLYPLGR